MNSAIFNALSVFCILWLFVVQVVGGELMTDQKIETDLVSSPITFDVLLPRDYKKTNDKLPLLLYLHGGGDRGYEALRLHEKWIEELWEEKELPPMVVATPHVGPLSFYLDFKDGSQKWESLVVGPFLKEVRRRFRVSSASKDTLMAGISMGGAGALQIGLKRPADFHAIAAIEPAIQPALSWHNVDRNMFFWFDNRQWEQRFGKPVSASFWADNNPASLVVNNAATVRKSGVKFYLECADQDYFQLHKGAEFLHRTMWDADIQHEYHVIHGADHVGRTLKPRVQEALRFLGNTLSVPDPDPSVEQFHKNIDEWRLNSRPRPSD